MILFARRRAAAILAGVAAALPALPALAHHPLGGETPTTFLHGFLSGIGHPMIGIDHFAFLIAVGLISAFVSRRLLAPLAFIAAAAVGCLLGYGGSTPPLLEVGVAASVVLAGLVALSGRQMGAPLLLALFAAAGIFHGAAYSEAVIGAEATPLAAYLLGLGLIQYAISLAVGFLARSVAGSSQWRAMQPRLAGAAVAGVGFAFLVENVEGLIFSLPA